jgi:hypothetical protein
MNAHIKAIQTKLRGERDEQLADLNVYLKNPVGVGEHPGIGEVIQQKIEKIESLDSQIECIDRYFNDPQMEFLG